MIYIVKLNENYVICELDANSPVFSSIEEAGEFAHSLILERMNSQRWKKIMSGTKDQRNKLKKWTEIYNKSEDKPSKSHALSQVKKYDAKVKNRNKRIAQHHELYNKYHIEGKYKKSED